MHLNDIVFNQAQEELVPSLLKYGTIKIKKKKIIIIIIR